MVADGAGASTNGGVGALEMSLSESQSKECLTQAVVPFVDRPRRVRKVTNRYTPG